MDYELQEAFRRYSSSGSNYDYQKYVRLYLRSSMPCQIPACAYVAAGICEVCKLIICESCEDKCPSCASIMCHSCRETMDECPSCEQVSCHEERVKCSCGLRICLSCVSACETCDKLICSACRVYCAADGCYRELCNMCSDECDYSCGESYCSRRRTALGSLDEGCLNVCGDYLCCNSCLIPCSECDKQQCDDELFNCNTANCDYRVCSDCLMKGSLGTCYTCGEGYCSAHWDEGENGDPICIECNS